MEFKTYNLFFLAPIKSYNEYNFYRSVLVFSGKCWWKIRIHSPFMNGKYLPIEIQLYEQLCVRVFIREGKVFRKKWTKYDDSWNLIPKHHQLIIFVRIISVIDSYQKHKYIIYMCVCVWILFSRHFSIDIKKKFTLKSIRIKNQFLVRVHFLFVCFFDK